MSVLYAMPMTLRDGDVGAREADRDRARSFGRTHRHNQPCEGSRLRGEELSFKKPSFHVCTDSSAADAAADISSDALAAPGSAGVEPPSAAAGMETSKPEFQPSDKCALSFVTTLLCDAINEFTHDGPYDYEYLPDQLSFEGTSKAESDEQVDPEEEEDRAWTSAAWLTEEALRSASDGLAVPAICSMSIEANASDASCDEDPACDGYEEILSLASRSSFDEEDHTELQANLYVSRAVELAKDFVQKRLCAKVGHPVLELEDDEDVETNLANSSQEDEDCPLDDEITSLASLSSFDDEEQEDLDAMHYASMACDFARKAVQTGVRQAVFKGVEFYEGTSGRSESEETSAELMQNEEDGYSDAADSDEHGVEHETLRREARDALLFASQDGRLKLALQQSDMANAMRESEDRRCQARDLLLRAAMDGRLHGALAEVKDASANKLRLKVRDTLMQSCWNGRLDAVMREVREEEEAEEERETLRLQARALLLKAAVDGSLPIALKELKQERNFDEDDGEDDEALRLEVRNLFLKGAQDGRLHMALRQAVAERNQEKRTYEGVDESDAAKCKATHSKCVAHEDQEEVDVEWEDETDEAETLRVQARDILLHASKAGHLRGILDEAEDVPEKEVPVEDDVELPRIDELRLRVRDVLMQASSDGRLDEVIRQCEKESDEELCRKAGSLLLEANLDGRLQRALQRVREQREEAAMRTYIRDVMTRAAFNGTLHATLEEVRADSAEEYETNVDDADQKQVVAIDTEAFTNSDLNFGRASNALEDAINFNAARGEKQIPAENREAEPAALQRPESPSVQESAPCERGDFEQMRCPMGSMPVPAEPFPVDCLPSSPLVLPAVAPSAANWTVIRSALSREEAAHLPACLAPADTQPQADTSPVDSEPTADVKSHLDVGARIARVAKEAVRKGVANAAAAAGADSDTTSPIQSPSASSKHEGRTMTPSRSRRRVIGGVVRSASQLRAAAEASNVAPQSPMSSDALPQPAATASKKKHQSSSGKEHKSRKKSSSRVPVAFNLDGSSPHAKAPSRSAIAFSLDCGDSPKHSPVRDSSLARGYDALGVDFYSMQDVGEDHFSAQYFAPLAALAPDRLVPDVMSRPSANGGFTLGALRVPSRGSGMSRHQSPSALLMDLGDDAAGASRWAPKTPSRQNPSPPSPSSSTSYSFNDFRVDKAKPTQIGGNPKSQGLLPSIAKSKSTGLLPMIAGKTSSFATGSAARNVHSVRARLAAASVF
mmetsp:Transcript_27668/g.76540  ORF Transcript_27668/g.76540 Transcript_27668/m.76540 type:complete len:1243 (-) Transcript_27668:235-3963(-)